MKNRILTVPELAFIVATRGMLGVGIVLLVSDKIAMQPRRAMGWLLVGVGALTTIPAAMAVFGSDDRRLIEPAG